MLATLKLRPYDGLHEDNLLNFKNKPTSLEPTNIGFRRRDSDHTFIGNKYPSHGKMMRAGLREEIPRVRFAFHAAPKSRFVIFAQGRTGSSLLTRTLNEHSEITCRDEILGRPRLLPIRFVNNTSRMAKTIAFGYHTKIYQLTERQRVSDVGKFLRGQYAQGWKIIYLWRENALRHVVSNCYANAIGSYHQYQSEAPPKNIRLSIEANRMIKGIELRLKIRGAERRALAGLPHLKICYEADLQGPSQQAATFQRVQEYLGVSNETLVPKLRKMVHQDLADLIDNFEDISRALRGTKYEKFLSDS